MKCQKMEINLTIPYTLHTQIIKEQLFYNRFKYFPTCILAPLYLMHPGTVVRVVNSYAATSEYTPAKLDSSVDLPTEGKPTKPIRASPVFATSKPIKIPYIAIIYY